LIQPTALQFALLSFTSPRLLARSVVNARRLSSGDPEDAVLSLLNICHTLESRPQEPAGRDPIDETIRLIRGARRSRAGRLHRLIAAAYTRLTPDARKELRLHVGSSLPDLVDVLAASESDLARLSAVDLAHDSDLPELIPSVIPLIEDENQAVSSGAREAVLRLARIQAERRARGTINSSQDAAVLSALIKCCDQFPVHRSVEIMDATVYMLDPAAIGGLSNGKRGSWFTDRDEAVRFGFRSALRRIQGPIGLLRAWEMLTEPELRRPAIERILTDRSGSSLDPILEHAHLGIRASRRQPIRSRISRAQRPMLFPTPDEIDRASGSARRGLCHWLDAINPDEAQSDALLEPLLADKDPSVRLAALSRAPGSLTRDFAFDDSPIIAVSATLRLVHNNAEMLTSELRTTLRRSPHSGVRELLNPRSLMCKDTILARRKLAEDHNKTIAGLRAKLETHNEFEISAAVHVIKRLGIADELTESLINTLESAFTRDDSPAWRVISSVLSVIPELPHPSVARLLAAARSHHDARVRSNAIEAEPRRPRGRVSSMVELITPACQDKHHRVKTSALRVLLKNESAPEDTVDQVLSTLSEQETASRAAALWLIERSVVELRPVAGKRWQDIAARVAGIAQAGDDDAERARATRCARRMLSEMKS
jgi:hypothetical protein